MLFALKISFFYKIRSFSHDINPQEHHKIQKMIANDYLLLKQVHVIVLSDYFFMRTNVNFYFHNRKYN